MRRSLTYLLLCVCCIFSTAEAETQIEWWQFATDPDVKPVVDSIAAEFSSANDGIEVKVTDLTWANGHEKIVVAFASGAGPDVVELGSDWIAQFAASGHIADISAEVGDSRSDFQGWSMAEYNDGIYAWPWYLGTRVIYGNKELIGRAGFDANVIPVTWGDLRLMAYKIDSLGDKVYGWGSNIAEKHRLYKKYLPFFWSNGAQIFTDDNRFCILSSKYAVEALKFYKELHDSCGFVATQRAIEDAFLDGKIGFIMSGDWLLRRIKKENSQIKFATTLMPGPRFPGRSYLGGEFLAINSASENPQEALKFIKYVTSPENQLRLCKAGHISSPSSIIAQKDDFFTSNPNLQTFIKQLGLANHPPVDPNWAYMESAIEEAIERALFGDGLLAEPLLAAQKRISKIRAQ